MEVATEFQLTYMETDSDIPAVAAVIVAAGNATRMGGPKQLLPLVGVPVLARSMMAFEACAAIRDIVVVARREETADVQSLADAYHIHKVTAIVPGGEERQHSVMNGLEAVAQDVQYVAIHDGARPLVTTELIESVLAAAKQSGAAAPGVPVTDTIKRVTPQGRIAETVCREDLCAMQTPQIFDYPLYRQALEEAVRSKLVVTDDCQIMEAAGFPVTVVPGDYHNIKITTPEDLVVAQALWEWLHHA